MRISFAFCRASIRWLRLRSGAAVCLVGELAAGDIGGADTTHASGRQQGATERIQLDLDLRSILLRPWSMVGSRVLQGTLRGAAPTSRPGSLDAPRCLRHSARSGVQRGHNPARPGVTSWSNRPIVARRAGRFDPVRTRPGRAPAAPAPATAARRRRTPCRPARGWRRRPAAPRRRRRSAMPPTEMSTRSSRHPRAQPRAGPPATVARSGAPDRPPAPAAATRRARCAGPRGDGGVRGDRGRRAPLRSARSATASMSSSARSGAILTSSGTADRRRSPRRPLAHRGEQRLELLDGLQVAQPGGVGRAAR